ncbi:MAG: glycosyltransferase family A protein [Cyanobacteriota bacterium]|nr:glycosyltransferase family A protein [Cyanobacteriota bacterium]
MGLSIVTVCMNRRDHLLATAPRVAAWPHHREHLIVDWSSTVPVRREELPGDERVRLLRVEGEGRWNLCRAYNFAMAHAHGELVLKLDADAWPTEAFDPWSPDLAGPLCAFGSGPGGRRGQFLMERDLFDAVGGFHELLVGYGFDDKDLLARLQQLTGEPAAALPEAWIGVIPHSDAERAEQGASRGAMAASQGLAAMRATRLANRLLAANCPWGPRTPRSRYRQEGPGLWRLEPESLPRPPQKVAAEAEHARRMTFWGFFLAIPEVFLEVLPYSLFPPPRKGRWDVRWWHRLWWQTGRRFLELPVHALVGGRRLLTGQPTGLSPGIR